MKSYLNATKLLQFSILAIFFAFAVLPALTPRASAEGKKVALSAKQRRAIARNKAASRILERVMKGEMTPDQAILAFQNGEARCAQPGNSTVDTFNCGDGKGNTVTVTDHDDCDDCKPMTGNAFSCQACCEAMVSRPQICVSTTCGVGNE